jgi:hypothetical protein
MTWKSVMGTVATGVAFGFALSSATVRVNDSVATETRSDGDHTYVRVEIPQIQANGTEPLGIVELRFNMDLEVGDEVELWVLPSGRGLPWNQESLRKDRRLRRKWIVDPSTRGFVRFVVTDIVSSWLENGTWGTLAIRLVNEDEPRDFVLAEDARLRLIRKD